MKKISMIFVVVACLLSCQLANYIPPVTPQMVAATRGRHVDVATLREGRRLLVHRCIECHTLPPICQYALEDWPNIVNRMSHRPSLKPPDRNAILACILAVRSIQ